MGRIQRQPHGDLATHAVADDGSGVDIVLVHECAHVVGHGRIAHVIHVRGPAVVAQVRGEDPVLLGEAPRDAAPVAAGTEQAVQNHHRWACRSLRLVAQGDAHEPAVRYLRRGK